MKLFPKIRLKLGQRSLRKRASLLIRKKALHNFETARNAGIIFEATNPEIFTPVKEFRSYLSSKNIKTNIIGYVNSEEIPGELIMWENCHFFCNKDLDFIFRPMNPQINSFLGNSYDIFFDLSLEDHFPIKYITALTPAAFKVGRFSETDNHFDLMISTGNQNSIEYLLENIKHYVSLLKKPVNKNT